MAGDSGVPEKKDLILANLDERVEKFVEALFNYWSGNMDKEDKDKTNTIPAEDFYQKMVTFGLAPDIKFIQEVTTITHLSFISSSRNRPKPPQRAARAGDKTPTRSARGSRANLHKSAESGDRGNNLASPTVSQFDRQESIGGRKTPTALQRRQTTVESKSPTLQTVEPQQAALRKQATSIARRNEPGASSADHSNEPGKEKPRGDDSSATPSRRQARADAPRPASPHSRPHAKEDDEKCHAVRLPIFHGIYGHGTQLRFVKLLLLYLKKQISKHIESKVLAKKAAQQQQSVKNKQR